MTFFPLLLKFDVLYHVELILDDIKENATILFQHNTHYC